MSPLDCGIFHEAFSKGNNIHRETPEMQAKPVFALGEVVLRRTVLVPQHASQMKSLHLPEQWQGGTSIDEPADDVSKSSGRCFILLNHEGL